MNVEEAMRAARGQYEYTTEYELAAETLADEVERLRFELVCANADAERLENQLDTVRSELVAATVKLDEWERVGLVAADLKELFRNDKIPPRGHIDALGRERLP